MDSDREDAMFKKILVATDLGDVSTQAVAVAAQLAREHESSLCVLHVIVDPMTQPWSAEAYGIDFPQLIEDIRRDALAQLKRLVASIKPALPIVRTEVLVGVPASEMVRYAHEQSIDLIVVGTHGRGPVRRAFLGSVADRVLREAPCPVLIVRKVADASGLLDAA
jgi:nucleotide-binding universal stress UspA family protein